MMMRMTIVVDIDPRKWMEIEDMPRKEVRADVERYVGAAVQELPLIKECAPDE